VLVLLAAALVVLTATGLWLWFRYQPTAADAWPTVKGAPGHDEGWIRITHRVTSFVVIVLAVATVVLVVGARIRAGTRGIVAGVGVLVTALAASFTGYLLPWDQLALWAVTTGGDMRGAQVVFRNEVKYVLSGTREVSPATYRFWAVAHVVLALLVVVTVVLAWLRTRFRALRPPSSAPEAVAVG
jgi:quinol-cytochrome oxidoreductase complex cytochrome b subunit